MWNKVRRWNGAQRQYGGGEFVLWILVVKLRLNWLSWAIVMGLKLTSLTWNVQNVILINNDVTYI